jgi:hypothetical protein
LIGVRALEGHMGERDERIDALKRTEGRTHTQLGGVERKYQTETNAPASDGDRDGQIAALTGQRNALQEQLARVQGELSELERGRDAERKAAMGRDSQSPKPSDSPGAEPSNAVQQDPPQQRSPGDDSPGSPSSGPSSSATQERGASSSDAGNVPTEEKELPDGAKEKGFPPFESSDTGPYGFDKKDITQDPPVFERPAPGEGFPGEWHDKSAPTAYKPYSQVLYEKQAAELDALDKSARKEADLVPAEHADATRSITSNPQRAGLSIETDAQRLEFDRHEFEFAAAKMNQLFADQDRERQQFGSNTLVDPHQSVVDREMELKRWDVTRDLCRDQADRELRPDYERKEEDRRQELEAKDAALLDLYSKRVADRPDGSSAYSNFQSDLEEKRATQMTQFRDANSAAFVEHVENRADQLQAQYFPAVHQNGPEQYVPAAPTRSLEPGLAPHMNDPQAGPPGPSF